MKRAGIVLLAMVVLVLLVPLANLLPGDRADRLTLAPGDDPRQARVFAILGDKCADCHTTDTVLPYYASLPVAGSMIRRDVEQGRRFMDFEGALRGTGNRPVSEVVLAKTERAVLRGGMPPGRYLALHWKARLSAPEREDLLAWIRDLRVRHYGTAGVASHFEGEPVQPLPEKVDLDPAKVALGRQLFHDPRLSRDMSLSCASCHALAKGGTDQVRYSTGVGGGRGGINSPTVFNSGLQFRMFWDGRAGTLEEQADGPVNNPIEMASSWDEVTPRLEQDRNFTAAFRTVYPEGYSKETLTEAIAVYERSLLTPSRFDRFLRGEADALTADEKHGYERFKEVGCATCHVGKLLGGQSFERMGRHKDYFAERGNVQTADLGRYNVTRREADRHHFKVPTLRNIAVTFPYLHDGSTSDLREVVELMAACQSDTRLTPADTEAIVRFLNTLTGEYEGKPVGT